MGGQRKVKEENKGGKWRTIRILVINPRHAPVGPKPFAFPSSYNLSINAIQPISVYLFECSNVNLTSTPVSTRPTGLLHPLYPQLELTPPSCQPLPQDALIIFFDHHSIQINAERWIEMLHALGRGAGAQRRRPFFLINPATLKAIDLGIATLQGRDQRKRRSVVGEIYLYMGLENGA